MSRISNVASTFTVLLGGLGCFAISHLGFSDTEPGLPRFTYQSNSRRFVLNVASNDQEPRGRANIRLLQEGKEVWQRTFPFPLSFARVLDDGTVAAFGYSRGWESRARDEAADKYGDNEYGDLVVVIIDPKGTIRVREAYRRNCDVEFLVGDQPHPIVGNVVVVPENDVVIFLTVYLFRLDDSQDDTAWRQFELSTGKPLGIYYPQSQVKDAKSLCRGPRVEPLPGTPLLLVQWRRLEPRGRVSLENLVCGSHFALLDKNCIPVWEMTLPDDYELPQDKNREKRLVEWVVKNSAILSVKAPGQFDLYFAKRGQRVSFAATQDKQGKWVVVETGRQWYTPPGLAKAQE